MSMTSKFGVIGDLPVNCANCANLAELEFGESQEFNSTALYVSRVVAPWIFYKGEIEY